MIMVIIRTILLNSIIEIQLWHGNEKAFNEDSIVITKMR